MADTIALACEPPGDSGLPVSRFTPTELAREANTRDIVEQISPRPVDRFLREARLRPHKSQYWLASKNKREDPERYQADVQRVCSTHQCAPDLSAPGAHVINTDEKTGMQAPQRRHETKPVRPGLVERVECEYIRHGTLSQMADFDVATDRVIRPAIGPTGTETDFVANIEKTADTDPRSVFMFIVDPLDTRTSASFVEMVARRCGIKLDLGVKENRRVLKSKQTRRAFLEDESHRIRFVCTPRHCSWLNQVETWFPIVARRLLRRSSFASCDELRTRVLASSTTSTPCSPNPSREATRDARCRPERWVPTRSAVSPKTMALPRSSSSLCVDPESPSPQAAWVGGLTERYPTVASPDRGRQWRRHRTCGCSGDQRGSTEGPWTNRKPQVSAG